MNRIIAPLVALMLICGVVGCSPNGPSLNDEPGDRRGYFDIEFHRGGRDARPENTLYAFQYALENGAATIECDMQLTADGQLVLSHDLVLNPDITTDGNGVRVAAGEYLISDMTLEELSGFNVGRMDETSEYYELHGRTQVVADVSIPTLRDLFELVRDSGNGSVRLSVEAKSWPDPAMGVLYENSPNADLILDEFLALVEEFGFEDRVALQSFDWGVLVKMEERKPEIDTVALYSEQPSWGNPDATTLWLERDEPSPWLAGANIHDFGDDPVKAAHSLGIDNVSPYYEEVTGEVVEQAHELGMKVIPWTVNKPQDMERLYDLGVDGIITDRPWILRDLLESKGEQVPPTQEIALPYHLEPDHLESSGHKAEGGQDTAY